LTLDPDPDSKILEQEWSWKKWPRQPLLFAASWAPFLFCLCCSHNAAPPWPN